MRSMRGRAAWPPPKASRLISTKRQNSSKDRKSTRLNSSHITISYAVFCLKKKKNTPSKHGETPFSAPFYNSINDTMHVYRDVYLSRPLKSLSASPRRNATLRSHYELATPL